MDKLVVRGTEINVQRDLKRDDFLSLTDIAKIKDSDNPRYIIQNWLRNRNTIYQRGNPAGGAFGKAQRHRHQPDEGADGGSQNAAVR